MITIFTDSTSYIPHELLKKHDIRILSLSASLDGVEYVETETDSNEFFSQIDKSNSFPKSSQPSLDDVTKAMEGEIAKGNSIVGVFLSSKMSGT